MAGDRTYFYVQDVSGMGGQRVYNNNQLTLLMLIVKIAGNEILNLCKLECSIFSVFFLIH